MKLYLNSLSRKERYRLIESFFRDGCTEHRRQKIGLRKETLWHRPYRLEN